MRARAARGSAYTRASVACESARAFDPLMNRHRVGTYPAGCWNSSRPKVGCHLPRGALEFQSVSKIACMMLCWFLCVYSWSAMAWVRLATASTRRWAYNNRFDNKAVIFEKVI